MIIRKALIFLLAVLLIAVLNGRSATAADPGHGAAAIASGTFESGNYTFPASIFVTDRLGIGATGTRAILTINTSNVSGAFLITNESGTNILFVNSTIGRVGIGTLVPSANLNVVAFVDTPGLILTGTGASAVTNANGADASVIFSATGATGQGSVTSGTAGQGGSILLIGGSGGTSGGGGASPGPGGNVNLTGGTGGVGGQGGPGGNVFITGGARGGSGNVSGNVILAHLQGMVGINTTSVTSTLQVQGTLNVSPGGRDAFFVDGAGGVRINTGAGGVYTEKLTINGSAVLTDNNKLYIGGRPGADFFAWIVSDRDNAYSFGADAIVLGINPSSQFAIINGEEQTQYLLIDVPGSDVTIPNLNFGVGTTTPGQTLTVAGTANVTGATYLGNSKCASGEVLTTNVNTGLVSCTSTGSGTVTGSGTTGYITRWNTTTSINNSVIYESASSIGIGTTAPFGLLHINSTNGSSIVISSSTTDGNSSIKLFEGGTSAGISIDYLGSFNQMRIMDISTSTNLVSIGRTGQIGINTTSVTSTLQVQGTLNVSPSGTTGLFVDSNGRTGIGTTSPTHLLHVAGHARVDGNITVYGVLNVSPSVFNSTNDRFDDAVLVMNIPSDGNGTIYVQDGGYLRRALSFRSTPNDIIIGQTGTALIDEISLQSGSSGNITFYTTGAETMKLDSAGRLGINTTGPTSTLQVRGTLNVSGNATGKGALYVGSTGKVGVGTTSPRDSTNEEFILDIYDDRGDSSGTVSTVGVIRNISKASADTHIAVDLTAYYEATEVVNQLIAIQPLVKLDSVGNVTNAKAIQSTIWLAEAGNITNAYNINVNWANSGGGAITNAYGVYFVDIPTGTNQYAIYQVGSDDKNYFAGNVGIGTTSPTDLLHVAGHTRVDGNITLYGVLNVSPSSFNGSIDRVTDAVMVMQTGTTGTAAIYAHDGGSLRRMIGYDANNNDVLVGHLGTVIIDDIILYPGLNGEISLYSGVHQTVVITGNKTGINQTGPTSTLEVKGTFNATGRAGGSLYMQGTGNVNITQNLSVEAILFEWNNTQSQIYVNASGCIIIKARNTIDATCP